MVGAEAGLSVGTSNGLGVAPECLTMMGFPDCLSWFEGVAFEAFESFEEGAPEMTFD